MADRTERPTRAVAAAIVALVTAPLGAQAGPAATLAFDVPPGYVQQRQGDVIMLGPATVSDRTPCIYGFFGSRPTSGDLERDAKTALLEAVVPGWRRLDDRHYAMRGVSADGWPYVWYRAAFEGDMGGQRQAVNAMAMVLPAAPGRVHVVWGMGNIARCLLDDATFEHLFHSLRPSGWTTDRGKALATALAGSWRFTATSGLQQLTFRSDGTYDRDLGTRARAGVAERTSSTAAEGKYSLRDGLLTLVPSHRPGNPDRYRVRAYDEWQGERWRRVMVLLDNSTPPLVIMYYRVDEQR